MRVKKLKEIEIKLLIDRPITRLEKAIWDTVSKQLSNESTKDNCDKFFEKHDGLDGLCCRVRMVDKPFAFCTYNHLLTRTDNMETSEREAAPFTDVSTRERWWKLRWRKRRRWSRRRRRSFSAGSITAPMFVDLLNVPCDNSESATLCTQYCCGNSRSSSLFCESNLPCF